MNGRESARRKAEMRPDNWQWTCDRIKAVGVPASDVEDLAQEVTLAMHSAERRMIEEGKEPLPESERRALLSIIVRRRVANSRRAGRWLRERTADADELAEIPDTAPSPEALALARAEVAPLRAALAELERAEPDRHAVFVAHQLHELPMAEIAASQGIRVNTAWTRLRLAREALLATVARHAARAQYPDRAGAR